MPLGRSIVPGAVLLMILAGCASDVANRYYGTVKYPPKDPAEVQLLRQAPTRDYVVIADFSPEARARSDSQESRRRRS